MTNYSKKFKTCKKEATKGKRLALAKIADFD